MITVNPLNNIVKTTKKPDWYCDHECVILVNIKNKIYKCDMCTYGLTCKRFSQQDIYNILNKINK
jgi:hypothetical protein